MSVKVSTEAIRNLLRNVAPKALTHAEIRDAMGYSKDDDQYISPRLTKLVKWPRHKIKVIKKDGKLAWYSTLKDVAE